MTASSVNIHYHGTNTPPTCHQDEVIHTMINSGETFQYDVQFPLDEPPGLYWYHPHIHGISEAAVQGGASGALIVEGIQNINPEVAGLPQQVLIIRDNLVPGNPTPGGNIPSWDVSLNYVPVPSPGVYASRDSNEAFGKAVLASIERVGRHHHRSATAVRWNAAAAGSGGAGRCTHRFPRRHVARAKSITETDILLAPAARAEFIVTGPSPSVKNATLMTLNVDTGPDGDNDPPRPLATVVASDNAPEPPITVPYAFEAPHRQRFVGLDREKPTAERALYFSEVLSDPSDPNSPTNFYITVDGQTPTLFSPDNPPAIVTTQGAVEDWTIENRALENHEFHIHQIHFLVLEQNGVRVNNGQYLDTVQIPYWSGTGPYPSVKVRMDFRGPLVGDFVYHCHILGHEDSGMMAIIRVKPRPERGRH